MSSLTSFQRKVVYLVLIILLLTGLSFLGRPAANVNDPNRRSSGGLLSQIREKNNIAATDLGALDPSGEAIRVATLGFRGVAAQMLWVEAENFKKKKDWTNLKATLNQISRLQPHQINVWKFQGWNLAYNVSVEFDNFKDRYRSVIDGLRYLQRGIKFNRHDMRLVWDLGRTTLHKIGRSDERKQFRKLFVEDDDYHSELAYDTELADLYGDSSLEIEQRDSWLVGRRWYKLAEHMVKTDPKTMIKGVGEMLFYNGAPLALIYYAENKQLDGKFDKAKQNWAKAEEDWRAFGDLPFETDYEDVTASTDDEKVYIEVKLNMLETLQEEIKQGIKELDDFDPGLRERLIAEKRAELPDDQREALDVPPAQRNADQALLAGKAQAAIKVTHKEVAARVPREHRKEAIDVAIKIRNAENSSRTVSVNRNIVNYDAWLNRTIMEQDADALLAHQLIYEGDRAFENNDTLVAREKYTEAFDLWRKMLDRYPALIEDGNFIFRLNEVIKRYAKILGQLNEALPDPFILQDVIEKGKEG